MCSHRPPGAALGIAVLCQLLLASLLWSRVNADEKAPAPQAKKEAVDEKAIRALVAQLGDESFDVREAAEKRLAALGEPALDLLEKSARESTDPEVRQRADLLVRKIGQGLFFQVRRFEGHTGAFTSDGKRVVSCGNIYNPTLRLWDVATGKQLLETEAVKEGFFCVATIPNSPQCLSTGRDGVFRLWQWKR